MSKSIYSVISPFSQFCSFTGVQEVRWDERQTDGAATQSGQAGCYLPLLPLGTFFLPFCPFLSFTSYILQINMEFSKINKTSNTVYLSICGINVSLSCARCRKPGWLETTKDRRKLCRTTTWCRRSEKWNSNTHFFKKSTSFLLTRVNEECL